MHRIWAVTEPLPAKIRAGAPFFSRESAKTDCFYFFKALAFLVILCYNIRDKGINTDHRCKPCAVVVHTAGRYAWGSGNRGENPQQQPLPYLPAIEARVKSEC